MDFSEIFFEPPTLGVRRTGIEQDEPPSLCARATILGWLVGRHWFWVHFRVAGFRPTRGGWHPEANKGADPLALE